MTLKLNAKNKNVLIISDTHFPHHHPDTLNFLKAAKKEIDPDIVIHIGDELDNQYLSFHQTIAECRGGADELTESIKGLKRMEALFNKMYILESNHGSLVFRKAKANGIVLTYIKPLEDIYGTPNWSWHHDIIIDTKHKYPTYFTHGKTSAYGRLCRELGMNAVQGHFHSKAEITWHKTIVGERYNMFVGAFADDREIAMEYGKNNVPKTILGCGMIDKEGNPRLLRMNLDSKGRWDRKLIVM